MNFSSGLDQPVSRTHGTFRVPRENQHTCDVCCRVADIFPCQRLEVTHYDDHDGVKYFYFCCLPSFLKDYADDFLTRKGAFGFLADAHVYHFIEGDLADMPNSIRQLIIEELRRYRPPDSSLARPQHHTKIYDNQEQHPDFHHNPGAA